MLSQDTKMKYALQGMADIKIILQKNNIIQNIQHFLF